MRSHDGKQAGRTGSRAMLLAVTAVAVLFAAACGSSSKSTTTGTTAPSSTGSTASTASSSPSGAAVLGAGATSLGAVLVDTHGLTLYTFDPENSGTIKCTATCAQTWHALTLPSGVTTPTAASGSGVTVALGTIARPEGTTQVTAAGHPLYTYSGDQAPGDTHGDGIGGVWHVAKAAASGTGTSPPASTSPGATTSTTYKY